VIWESHPQIRERTLYVLAQENKKLFPYQAESKGLLNTDLSEGQYLTRVMSPRREEKGNARCIPHYGA
jgi:hypothetical protein